MENSFYQNGSNHHGFIYQNSGYMNNDYVNPMRDQANIRALEIKNDLPLATIYVRPQIYKGISSPAEAFRQGTAFAELYRPFIEKGGPR